MFAFHNKACDFSRRLFTRDMWTSACSAGPMEGDRPERDSLPQGDAASIGRREARHCHPTRPTVRANLDDRRKSLRGVGARDSHAMPPARHTVVRIATDGRLASLQDLREEAIGSVAMRP